ncbi:MAG TPA: outer membrane beta-barrel protein [Verrucomicrobiae bacterium]|nr:outer membrane beta-barrel protein [Verrucomicrobiae bacterium]
MKKLNVKNQRKFNQWTVALAAIGVVSLASAARADEKMSMVQTALSNTTISGYVDTSATWRPGTDQNGASVGVANLPKYLVAHNDGFSLDQVDIAIDHPEDESPWAAGYHIEFFQGADQAGMFGAAASPFRQAYVVVRTPVGNGIDWKVGMWDNIIGYESTSIPLNPNYTHSYAWGMEPTAHTGLQANYKVNDEISVIAAIADSSNVGKASPSPLNGTSIYESQKSYLGLVTLTAPDSFGWMKGATLTFGAENSVDSNVAPGTGSKTSWYAGVTVPTPLTALTFGGSYDYLDLHGGGGEFWAINLYSTYHLTDKASFNLRGEYFQDDTGVLYGGGATTGTGTIIDPNRNAAEELTATFQYNMWANVISRVEFRWDHVEHGNAFGANSAGAAFRDNDFMLALNLIYQF